MKKIISIVCLTLAFFLGACSNVEVKAEQTYPLKIWKQNENGSYNTLCVVDEDTGVNYVVVSIQPAGGRECAVSVTPRLNADGSLYVTD